MSQNEERVTSTKDAVVNELHDRSCVIAFCSLFEFNHAKMQAAKSVDIRYVWNQALNTYYWLRIRLTDYFKNSTSASRGDILKYI